MNFDRNEKKLLKGSHDLWERNQKIVHHKIFLHIEGNYSCKIHFSLQCQFLWFKVWMHGVVCVNDPSVSNFKLCMTLFS